MLNLRIQFIKINLSIILKIYELSDFKKIAAIC